MKQIKGSLTLLVLTEPRLLRSPQETYFVCKNSRPHFISDCQTWFWGAFWGVWSGLMKSWYMAGLKSDRRIELQCGPEFKIQDSPKNSWGGSWIPARIVAQSLNPVSMPVSPSARFCNWIEGLNFAIRARIQHPRLFRESWIFDPGHN